jgi:hypothetical protein
MIIIDDVYQRVLALANKEQRGYITPQEFNLYANQAQQEIFEQYFYDLNQFARIPGNDYVYADVDDMLEEKLQVFENTDTAATILGYTAVTGGFFSLPSYIYRVSKIEYNSGTTTVDCDILKTKDFNDCVNGGPLTRPNDTRPIANIRNNVMRVMGGRTFAPNIPITPTSLIYFKKPATVAWGYYVVGLKALYDSTSPATLHFELHPSEETELVYKILKYAGISMDKINIMRAGQVQEQAQVQQEKL